MMAVVCPGHGKLTATGSSSGNSLPVCSLCSCHFQDLLLLLLRVYFLSFFVAMGMNVCFACNFNHLFVCFLCILWFQSFSLCMLPPQLFYKCSSFPLNICPSDFPPHSITLFKHLFPRGQVVLVILEERRVV